MSNLATLSDEQLDAQLSGNAPEVETPSVEEPIADNPTPEVETTTEEPLPTTEEAPTTEEPIVEPIKSLEVIDDNFIANHPDLSPEFLRKFKGKTVADVLKSTWNLEKLHGKVNHELQLYKAGKNLQTEQEQQQEVEQPAPTTTEDIASDLVSRLMKNKYPDFSKDWLEDLFITSPLEAMKVAREMEKFEETAQRDAEIIQDWQTNHLDYNWKEGLSAIDIIKDELSERDITLEELGLTNERIINVLSSMGINGQKNSLEENLALALFFDDNGNLDKSVHQPLYGKDKVRPDFLVRKFLNSSKEAIKRVKEEKRFNIENNAKKQGFKDASSKKPAPLLSSTSGGIGTMPKPTPMKSVSQLGDDELEIALRKAERSQY